MKRILKVKELKGYKDQWEVWLEDDKYSNYVNRYEMELLRLEDLILQKVAEPQILDLFNKLGDLKYSEGYRQAKIDEAERED